MKSGLRPIGAVVFPHGNARDALLALLIGFLQRFKNAQSLLREPVILVVHSYAGMIISGVAEAMPHLVQHLVFIDAFIPENGQCVLDLLPPEIVKHFRSIAAVHGAGWRLPGGEGQLDLWGLKEGPSRDFVSARLCDFSLRCFEEPILLQTGKKSNTLSTFISCVAKDYPARPFFQPFAAKARELGWNVIEIDSGHDCHVERPGDVAGILLSTPAAISA